MIPTPVPMLSAVYLTAVAMLARLSVRGDLVRTFERALVRAFAFGVVRSVGLGVVGVVVVALVLSPSLRKMFARHRP